MSRRGKPPRTASPSPPTDPYRGKVVVAYCHPGQVDARFHTSIIDLFIHDMFSEGRIIRGGGHFASRSGANIVNARNELVRMFLDMHQAEWLFMVDADMSFDRDTIDRLVEAADPETRPIVGALCFGTWEGAESQDLFPTIYWWVDNPRGVARALEYPDDTVMQVGATGAACILIHRSVLEKMRDQYPGPWHWYAEQIFDGRPMSEDITFCLRASALGIPVHVHTGVKTGHAKSRVLDEKAFAEWKARQTEPGFVITGTGRSGTGYIAHLLRQLGIRCGHESWWNPHNRHEPNLDGDASWLAAPLLHLYQGHVFHQLRDPIRVIDSLRNGEMFQPGVEYYLRYADLHTPGGFTDNLEGAVRFCAHWLQLCDERAELTWKLEDVDAPLLVELTRRVGKPCTLEQAQKALEAVPRNVNQHGPKPGIRWTDLPDLPETAWLRSWAERWQYPTQP